MEKEKKNQRQTAKYVAYSGVIAACCVAVMLLGSYITTASYVCVAIASFLIYTIREECDLRHALVAYICVSILSVLFVPYKKMVWLFVLLVGYYPLLKPVFDKIKNRGIRMAGKLTLCNATMAFLFYGTAKLIYTGEMMPEVGKYAKVAAILFVLAGNAAFLCYDYALSKILRFYRQLVSPRLKKILRLR